MSEYNQQDRTLALAGIYQSAKIVFDLASSGQTDETAFHTSVHSLFVENPSNTLNVFGDSRQNLALGLSTLLTQMKGDANTQKRNLELTRYVLNLMVLAKKLNAAGEPLNKISNILETAKSQQTHFGEMHENVIATLARAYTENVSVLQPRIMVNGHHQHLSNQRIANKIRAALLSGIRSALLWYQVGGSRWELIWSRKKYLSNAQEIVQRLDLPKSDNVTPLFPEKGDDEQTPKN